ncbi:rod shape-determining protein RodA [Clostridium oryzae]|uniref:Rod shape-determining protein RodA n=1 Tax=Clostridium oryzae TaxID=1450648 RepID=A0A1V4IV24_9CLOT|nr:rod shape-determining protein RodA [Clostridium oryzae]OPJ63759.1 Rod shape-determining protein RodA [Clostridium oryzae]
MLGKFTVDRKVLKHFDFGILLVALIIVAFGCINIYYAVGTHLMKMQILFLLISVVVVCVMSLIDYNVLGNYAYIFYAGTILLLIYNDVAGKVVNGAKGWIRIGGVSMQPSEFAKLAMLILLAKKLEDMEGNINNVKNFMILTFYAAIPMGLIIIQPDMGMTMVCFFIALGIYFIMGLDLKIIVGGLASLAVAVAILFNSSIMPEYWKSRLTVFLHPEADELGKGLQIVRSLIAIGSGSLFGSGEKIGPASHQGFINFVPERQNDFIFAVVGEKWGFVGSVMLLLFYAILLVKILKIARSSKDIFGTVICVGVFSSFLFSVVWNIGMAISMLPVSGLTLPFMSAGGSSLVTNFIALGLVINVGMRRKKINF